MIEILIAFLAPLAYIVSISSLFIYLFRKRYSFQTVLPVALISSVIFVFLFTMIFHKISIAIWILVGMSLISIPLFFFDKEKKKFLSKNLLTPGFVMFTLVYVFVFVLDWLKIIPLQSDSTMHWAPHVWTMWLRDDFYTSPGLSIVIHGDYPPAAQLFEIMWLRLAGVYHEGLLYISLIMLSFSMIVPAFEKFSWSKHRLNDWISIVVWSSALILLPLIFFVSDFYSTLEVDTLLAFLFAYGVYLAIDESRELTVLGLVKLSLLITFICLTKQIAIILASIIILVFLCNLIITYHRKIISALQNRSSSKKDYIYRNWKKIVALFAALVLPLLCINLWSSQIQGYSSPDKGVAIFKLDPKDILQLPSIITKESGTEAQQEFSRSFVDHVLFDPGGFLLNHVGGLSFFQVTGIFLLLMILLFCKTKNREEANRVILVAIIVCAGWFFYCFTIYAVFLFGGMNAIELSTPNTPNRYLRTYLFGALLIFSMLAIHRIINHRRPARTNSIPFSVILAIIVLFVFFFNRDTFNALGIRSGFSNQNELESLSIDKTKEDIENLQAYTSSSFEKPSQILITASSDKERHHLQYTSLPDRITLIHFEEKIKQTTICSRLKSSDYLVVGNRLAVDYYLPRINNCLLEPQKLKESSVYEIINDKDQLSLELMP